MMASADSPRNFSVGSVKSIVRKTKQINNEINIFSLANTVGLLCRGSGSFHQPKVKTS